MATLPLTPQDEAAELTSSLHFSRAYTIHTCMMRRGPDNSSVNFGISDAFSWKTNTLSRAQHWADVKSLNTPLNNISVMRSSSALQGREGKQQLTRRLTYTCKLHYTPTEDTLINDSHKQKQIQKQIQIQLQLNNT